MSVDDKPDPEGPWVPTDVAVAEVMARTGYDRAGAMAWLAYLAEDPACPIRRQRAADPPLFFASDGIMGPIQWSLAPGKINYYDVGALDPSKPPLAFPRWPLRWLRTRIAELIGSDESVLPAESGIPLNECADWLVRMLRSDDAKERTKEELYQKAKAEKKCQSRRSFYSIWDELGRRPEFARIKKPGPKKRNS